MAGDTIVLYDLPSAALPDKAWSPNVWKIRFLLNYKCLPYRTEWIETPDLAPFAKKFGAPPSFFTEKGVPRYTAPIIYCPRARSFFSNSLEIAIYLERAYPDTPPLFHGEFAFALVRAWDDLWNDNVAKVMEKLMMMRTYEQFPPRSAAGFRMSRERIYGIPLEAHAPPEQAPALWKQLREALTRFHLYIDGARFVAGNEITYPDVISAGWLVYVKRLCGQNSEEWCQIELWNEGRWKKLMEVFSEWEHTDAAVEVLDARSGEEVSRVARLWRVKALKVSPYIEHCSALRWELALADSIPSWTIANYRSQYRELGIAVVQIEALKYS